MAHVIPSSTTSISLTPSVAFLTKTSNILATCSIPRKLNRHSLTAQNYATQFRIGCFFSPKLTTHIASAIGTDVVAVEEVNTTPKEDEAKRSRPVRKSDMPPVKNEELLPGASFTGKVRSIQAFGAFVDFGAFTDGLVHVSQLSDSFVKDVATVVTVGQEVTVRLVEANIETGRISLTMRESDDTASDKSRPPQKTGQKFNQKKDDNLKLDEKLSQGVVHTATNPFVLAFHSNKDISGFLDEQVEKAEEIVQDTNSEAR